MYDSSESYYINMTKQREENKSNELNIQSYLKTKIKLKKKSEKENYSQLIGVGVVCVLDNFWLKRDSDREGTQL